MVDFPDDEFSVVKLYNHIQKHFIPHVCSNIIVDSSFRRRVSPKIRKVSFVVVFE